MFKMFMKKVSGVFPYHFVARDEPQVREVRSSGSINELEDLATKCETFVSSGNCLNLTPCYAYC